MVRDARAALKVDLSSSRLSGLEARAVMDLVGVAQAEVGSAQKRIFGEGKKLTRRAEEDRGAGVRVQRQR